MRIGYIHQVYKPAIVVKLPTTSVVTVRHFGTFENGEPAVCFGVDCDKKTCSFVAVKWDLYYMLILAYVTFILHGATVPLV